MKKNIGYEPEVSATFLNDFTLDFVDFIWRNVPGIEVFLLVDNKGTIKFKKTSESFDEKNLPQINGLISNMVNQFQELNSKNSVNKLNLTVNIFENDTVLIKPVIEGFFFVLVLPNNTSYSDSVRFVTSLQKT